MNRIVIAMVGLIAAGLAAYGLWVVWNRMPPAGSPGQERVSTVPAPNLSFKDYSGNTVSLADFRGRPVVVNSWATWCPFCWRELLDFAAVQTELGDRVVLIAVNRAELTEVAKRFTDDLGLSNRLILLLDADDSLYRSIGGFSMPETIFVDREGNIVIHKRGPMPLEEIREKIQGILN